MNPSLLRWRAAALVLILPVGVAAQPLASDYHSLSSVGLLAGMVTVTSKTQPIVGAALGVDRGLGVRSALRLHIGAWLNTSTSDLVVCTTPTPCGPRRAEISASALVGPEWGRREAGIVAPFAGLQIGAHRTGVTRDVGTTGQSGANGPAVSGLAAGAYLGVRTGQARKHFRGTLGYTVLGAVADGGARVVSVTLGVEW